LFSYHFEKFTGYSLKILCDSDIMFTSQVSYSQRVFIPVSRYVKIIKIHQYFPELWSQMYCHLFLQFTMYIHYNGSYRMSSANNNCTDVGMSEG